MELESRVFISSLGLKFSFSLASSISGTSVKASTKLSATKRRNAKEGLSCLPEKPSKPKS